MAVVDAIPDPLASTYANTPLQQGNGGQATNVAASIRTPDQRLRVFVSSTLEELAAERHAARDAIGTLRLTPVMFELGARPHPPRALYRAYLAQSDVFVGIYWQRYGWMAPGEPVSGLEDEYLLCGDRPKLIYVKVPAPQREDRLTGLLQRIEQDDQASYHRFATVDELRTLLADDLALLLTERFDQVRPCATPAEATPSRPARPLRPRDHLVGRERELTWIEDLLRDDVGLVTLTGAGGVGKSRLALQVAADLQTRFPDGIVVVELDAVRYESLLFPTIARALGVTTQGPHALDERLLDFLRDRRMLLVLDNVEQLVSAAPLATRALLVAPGLRLLATSRQPLHIHGERVVEILPLPVPAASISWQQVAQSPSVQLFVERAQAAKPSFALTMENAAAVAEICRRLDGLPLAILLAAGRVNVLSPRALLARLEHRLPLLTGGARDAPQRQRTLRDAVAWSYDLLEASEGVLFRRLGVFLGGFTLAAARAVCAVSPRLCVDEWSLLDTLDALVEKSLLRQREGEDGEPRFDMLAIIREFAEEQLVRAKEEAAVRAAHASYYLGLAEEAEPSLTSTARATALATLEAEHENLRAALVWGLDHDHALALRLAGALTWFWDFSGYVGEGRAALDAALALPLAPTDQGPARAKALFGAGLLAWLQYDHAVARERLQEAVTLWEQQGNDGGRAYALVYLGMALLRPAAAVGQRTLDQGIALFRATGDRWGLALGLRCRAWGAAQEGDQQAAAGFQGESLALYRQLHDDWGIAAGLKVLGERAYRDGDFATARTELEEALTSYRRIADKFGLARAAALLAGVLHEQGEYARAETLLEESLALNRELGARWAVAWTLDALGLQARERGDYLAARIRLEESLALARESGDPVEEAWSLDRLGTVAHAVGDLVLARSRYERALRLAQEIGDRRLPAWTTHNLGCLALDEGDVAGAGRQLSDSLATFHGRREQVGMAHALAALGAAAVAEGRPERAFQLVGAAEALAGTAGVALIPWQRTWLERHLASAQQALDPTAAGEAREAGRALPVDQIVAFALEGPD